MSKKVLIFEYRDELRALWNYYRRPKNDIQGIFATNAKEAETLFVDNMDICAIVVTAPNDVSLLLKPGDSLLPEVEALVKRMRNTFNGPIMVASNLEKTTNALMEAGCDHHCEHGKLFEKLLEILSGIR